MTKRAIDILGASLGLLVLSPVMILLWALVRTKLGSPVIFAQQRPGKDGRIFTLYKFRSMLEKDPTGEVLTDEQRMTNFGRRLRATSLDELPSLFNVLKGDMSLVGPRPLNVGYLELYTPHQSRRHDVRPGITGLAQVNGRNSLSWEERFDLDVTYVDTQTTWLDLKIILRTITEVLDNSDVEGEIISTMTTFVGPPPQDGLIEEPLDDRWSGLRDSWQHSSAALNIGNQEGADPKTIRHWVYREDPANPVGIASLSGLGGPELNASIVLGPGYHTSMAVEALLNRLLHHAKTYDAHRIYLRLSDADHELYETAERLGFVPIDLSTQDARPDGGELLVAFALQTGN